MQLVILAAGHGRRFGGLKQLAPVGPGGEAIFDYTARSAHRCGYDGVVVIVREEIRDEMLAHIEHAWPADLEVAVVDQMPLAGTTPAVLSARAELHGPFGVANADDLYGEAAISTLREQTLAAASSPAPEHVMVAYRLANSVLTDAPLTRGLCEVSADGHLARILEQSVRRRPDGSFDAADLGPNRRSDPDAAWEPRLHGDELVSMNLWGFQPSVLEALAAAVAGRDPDAPEGSELLLPDVVAQLVAQGGEHLRVVSTESRCIGLTHPDDLGLVQQAVAAQLAAGELGPSSGR